MNLLNQNICGSQKFMIKLKLYKGYVGIQSNDLHQNVLWIKEDIYFGKMTKKTDYGIQVDDICFSYIKPGAKRCNLNGQIEIGYHNWKSNKCIQMENFYVEERKGKPGGMILWTKNKAKVKLKRNFCIDYDKV